MVAIERGFWAPLCEYCHKVVQIKTSTGDAPQYQSSERILMLLGDLVKPPLEFTL
jgi:hypothetical protein